MTRRLDDAARGVAGKIKELGRKVTAKGDEALSQSQRLARQATQRRKAAERGGAPTRRAHRARDDRQARTWRTKAAPGSDGATLRRNLETIGEKRKEGQAAHHIVPKGRYGGRAAKEDLYEAQAALERAGIDPDDAANGMFLGKELHGPIHTNRYFEELSQRLGDARDHKGRATAILRDLAEDLEAGRLTSP